MTRPTIAKLVCAILVTVVFGLMIRTIAGWTETRGVFDDICYLRQAHLFQRFGLSGLDTDVARDTDGFLVDRLNAVGYAKADDPAAAPCHNRAATGRIVMQYPPGTGFVMAAFTEGRQIVPLYATVAAMLLALALVTIAIASTAAQLAAATSLGALSLYLMNNPVKSSYSLPPTVIVCALAGALTAWLVAATGTRRRIMLAAGLGFVFGLGVDFRIANMILMSGAGFYLLIRFIRGPRLASLAEGAAFGGTALIGMLPTLAANAINAGSPFATTYSAQDALPPDVTPSALAGQLMLYLGGTQGTLIVAALVLTAIACWRGASRQAGWITATMLAVNLGYFLSHPVFTPYYVVPAAMLALWTLLFAFLCEKAGVHGPRDRQMVERAPT